MRLLDCLTLEFREVQDATVKYAILSHRWGDDEITFQDMQIKHLLDRRRSAYTKITEFCRLALERGLEYAWIDTCCINKDSSAELSEAINSMWRWYRNSTVCVAYLSDFTLNHDESNGRSTVVDEHDANENQNEDFGSERVPPSKLAISERSTGDDVHVETDINRHEENWFTTVERREDSVNPQKSGTPPTTFSKNESDYYHDRRRRRRQRTRSRSSGRRSSTTSPVRNPHLIKTPTKEVDHVLQDALKKSTWFYRSWTLQELLSPTDVIFYDSKWSQIGTKLDLAPTLSAITSISVQVLENHVLLYDLPVAERMSWASQRRATRVEDEAYSLLGLFDVNMPMLYGEGSKAFTRLQEYIIQRSNDHTIFLWDLLPDEHFHAHFKSSKKDTAASTRCIHSMFAPSPSAFSALRKYDISSLTPKPFNITNSGMQITLTLQPWVSGVFLGLLECFVLSQPEHTQTPSDPSTSEKLRDHVEVYNSPRRRSSRAHRSLRVKLDKPLRRQPGIFLRRREANDMYERVMLDRDFYRLVDSDGSLSACQEVRTILIDLQRPQRILDFENAHGFRIRTLNLCPERECFNLVCMSILTPLLRIIRCADLSNLDFDDTATIPVGRAGSVAFVRLETCEHWPIKFINLGFDFDLQPVCALAVENGVHHNDLGMFAFDCIRHTDWIDMNSFEGNTVWPHDITTHAVDKSELRLWRCYLRGSQKPRSIARINLPSIAGAAQNQADGGSRTTSSAYYLELEMNKVRTAIDEHGRRVRTTYADSDLDRDGGRRREAGSFKEDQGHYALIWEVDMKVYRTS